MGMLVQTSLKNQILEAQGEALKVENLKEETLHHLEKEFESRSNRVHYFKDKVGYQRLINYGQQYWMKPIDQGIKFIQDPIKCTSN